ncbi:histidine phosphatase family protein [filamentous cyanobacterium LEGE 11480]|uniref:Histidine phosphatase family protein n=1 Tax=Romeriopsis navalis LEGE 11480 TaxID=2777977 RepID=A0A928VN31_9CYAN|nr:histidine phosphatase family protein [Romeriopsis navalis]MBE9031633.1 histidine phosphatase family protein [Romeriopsis navalis LEGE 11480]
MTDALKLLFIRHAQSTGNLERRMQGHGDYPLTNRGRSQTRQLAERLRTENCVPTAIYTSPLKRTVQTAEILCNAFASERLVEFSVHYVPELAEFQNGVFQGLTWDEAKAQYPDLCHQLETHHDWIAIPEAETLQDARDRAQTILNHILTNYQNGDCVWLVSHSWIMQHLISELLGSPRSWRLRVQNTAIFEFWIDQSRWHRSDINQLNTDLWQIVRFNDVSHLDCD